MVGWLEPILVAVAIVAALWALLVVLAGRLRVDPRVPWQAKAAVVVAGLWVLSPVDLLPEFLPVIGPLDDVVVVALALRFAARWVPRQVLWEAWPGDPRLLERLLGPSAASTQQLEEKTEVMNEARPDAQRTRFRRPLGVAIMAYKSTLGLIEIVVGMLLAVPSFDPQATFAVLLLRGRLPGRPLRSPASPTSRQSRGCSIEIDREEPGPR